jgi:hypothetical protein
MQRCQSQGYGSYGDGCACSHMQVDDSMSDASLTRKATAANLTRWQDHEEAVVAKACTARHTFQAIQPASPERLTAQAQRQRRWQRWTAASALPRKLHHAGKSYLFTFLLCSNWMQKCGTDVTTISTVAYTVLTPVELLGYTWSIEQRESHRPSVTAIYNYF